MRIVYLERGGRGGMLRGVRLFGQGVDTRCPDPKPDHEGVQSAAGWVADQLASTRAAGAVEWVCLDSDGGVCSWVSSPSHDPTALAAIARMGSLAHDSGQGVADSETTPAGHGPIPFFAGDELESSVQRLAHPKSDRTDHAQPKPATQSTTGPSGHGATPDRLPVLAVVDAPARVFLDALDARGVRIGSTLSLWHALAQAWDPSSPLARAASRPERTVATSHAATAVVLVDPAHPSGGRLVWCWSEDGRVLAAGSQRLRTHDAGVTLSAGDGARLAAEFLAWSLQLGRSPQRVLCVLPENQPGAREFGEALAATIQSVDALAHPDPIGATFARLVSAIEATPDAAPLEPGMALMDLSNRPGRSHRTMYMWGAAALTLLAIFLGVVGWFLRDTARDARHAADRWKIVAQDTVGTVRPNIFGRLDPPKTILADEIAARRKELFRPDRAEPAMPVLDELSTLSLILGSNDYSLESVDLNSSDVARFVVRADSLAKAEDLQIALTAISGSHVASWNPRFEDKSEGGKDKYVRAQFLGTWKREAPKGTTP